MKTKAIIFDLDGTIAKRDKGPDGRSPYDMTRVGEDTPAAAVLTVAKLLAASGEVEILFVSGRDDTALDDTILWLNKHFGPQYRLYMRPENDNRPDETMKKNILDEVKELWEIVATFDDRNRVVDMWRDNGVTCFQVCSREEGGF